ncbi:MAG: virulence factor SrfB [Deltaproteobacteria bacterium]|nr:virulence factor SrfB [Deltaproteobacteria bacterium]
MKRNKSFSIIAGGALQFIDCDIDLSVPFGRGDKPMAKARVPFHVARLAGSDQESVLVPLKEREDCPGEYVDRLKNQPLPLHYEIEFLQAFNCLQGQWLPIPFLVETGQWDDHLPRYGYGPTDWVRAYLTRLGSEESLRFRLTLVFDPQVESGDGNINLDGGMSIYHALSESDVAGNSFFSLAAHERDNSWFIDSLPWVKEALRKVWDRYKSKYPRKLISRVSDDLPDYAYDGPTIITEYMAVYETFLWAVYQSGGLSPTRVINPKRVKPIEVDLVIDIGNSRLTGVLVETVPQRATKLTDCYSLQARDLSAPANIYGEPLDTKVEFAEPYFGPIELSLKSRQHSDSFIWPSTVRLGPEATRLSANSREEMGPTGMSSPKRYLWDTKQRELEWHLNNYYERHRSVEEPAVGRGSFLMSVNTAGVPVSVVKASDGGSGHRVPIPQVIKSGYSSDDDIAAFEARYSRSSLMMFLLSEVIAQALSCVNNPIVRDNREHPDTPRRLQSVILTVPTAMPLAEQNIFKTWAYLAVESVWSSLRWDDYYRPAFQIKGGEEVKDFRQSPLVRCDWDEATCTQIVWLYNELYDKFHNNAVELFDLLGRQRPIPGKGGGKAASSLRLASVDIGGGTSDLSITTYFIHNPGQSSPLIKPNQEFRDGFNVAGDDIMRKIILTQFLKNLAKAATERGVADADSHIAMLFKDTAKMGTVSSNRSDDQLRSQFVAQIAAPVALYILKHYETVDLAGDDFLLEVNVGQVLGFAEEKPSGWMTQIINYLEAPLRRHGWPAFDLLDFTFTVDAREVDADVSMVMGKIMNDMGEIIKLYECDLLILTGRPSCWPAIVRAPYERICLPVDRITHMHKYRVGAAYPFVTHGRIEDPKTTVVVGAIICALAEGSLEGITIDTSNFVPQPINRYIGMLDGHGRLSKEHVWFDDLDLQSGREIELTREIEFNAPVPIGFRQLNCSRWTTTRLYTLDYRSPEAQKQAVGRLPYLVTIELIMVEVDETAEYQRKSAFIKRTEGTLKVVSVTDKNGQGLPPGTVVVRLQTLRSDSGYWLDTGALENI